MGRHIRKCKWCKYDNLSYRLGWYECNLTGAVLTDNERKRGCVKFKPNEDCPESVCKELGFEKPEPAELLEGWLSEIELV